MLAALFTAGFFAVTVVVARRAALLLGPTPANLGRLMIAAMILGIWAIAFGTCDRVVFGWFFLSGLAGFGLGGLSMFHALPRAGSNMANLIVQCGSVVVALTIEQLWLGTRIRAAELACLLAILSGVVFALTPRSLPQFAPRQLRRGAMLAALAALGQGSGAVLSRRAFGIADASEFAIDPGSAAFQRVLGGLLFAGVAFVVARGVQPVTGPLSPDIRRAWPWVLANALTGPVLGVTCLQWALRTTPAAIVQSIVALAPLATAPLAMAAGESLPRRRYFVGASIAVLATMTLAWLR